MRRRDRTLAGVGLLGVLASLAAMPAGAGHGAGGLVPSYRAEHVRRFLEAEEPVVLVDVRPRAAYRAAHLPGARSLPLAELDARAGEIPRAGRVILYGESIIQASEAHAALYDRGYRNVGVLEDGFTEWMRRGFPVEPGR